MSPIAEPHTGLKPIVLDITPLPAQQNVPG